MPMQIFERSRLYCFEEPGTPTNTATITNQHFLKQLPWPKMRRYEDPSSSSSSDEAMEESSDDSGEVNADLSFRIARQEQLHGYD